MVFVTICLIFLSLTGIIQGQTDILNNPFCPSGYLSIGELCYKFSTDEATWNEALQKCQSAGGTLATIGGPDLQIFLGGFVDFKDKVSNINVKTGNDYVYHYLHDLGVDITGRNSITFMVQACNDAHVAFSSVKGLDTKDTYEIVLGGWGDTASVIRDCKQCTNRDEMKSNIGHPLSCTDKRPFWISWSNYFIRVGTGNDVGENQFMAWNDTDPHPVNYIAIATGWGAHGDWTFPLDLFMPGKFWVGGSYARGGWVWVETDSSLSGFTDWAPNEPDNAGGNQFCMAVDMHEHMKWRDDTCGEKRNYICQHEMQTGPGNGIIG